MKNYVYTVAEVAEIIHCNKNYVYKLINSKQLPALKLGSYKVRAEALEKFLIDCEGGF